MVQGPPATKEARAKLSHAELREKARQVRVDALKMTTAAGSGHPGGSMSMADVLAVLYYNRMRIDPANPRWADRDRFVLSKGHCCPGLYAVLGHLGFFPTSEFERLRKMGGLLQGHADMKVPGCDFSAGSLGMGLSFGHGVALAARVDGRDYRTYVMMGDGECQEGQVWEAAMAAAHYKTDNLTAILDLNGIQIDGFTRDVKNLEPIGEKWRAFGWHVIEINGHDYEAIEKAFDEAEAVKGRPTIVIAHSVKGKGVSWMENNKEFHGRSLTPEELKKALAELGAA